MLAEALATLTIASLAIALLPFRTVAAAASVKGAVREGADRETIRRVRSAVQAWGRRVPWKAVCFQRGLAVHWMLRRRGPFRTRTAALINVAGAYARARNPYFRMWGGLHRRAGFAPRSELSGHR